MLSTTVAVPLGGSDTVIEIGAYDRNESLTKTFTETVLSSSTDASLLMAVIWGASLSGSTFWSSAM